MSNAFYDAIDTETRRYNTRKTVIVAFAALAAVMMAKDLKCTPAGQPALGTTGKPDSTVLARQAQTNYLASHFHFPNN